MLPPRERVLEVSFELVLSSAAAVAWELSWVYWVGERGM